MLSNGLWLMPALPPRTNSIACGIASCSFIASWPAPLGMRWIGKPSAVTAASQRACHAGSQGAAAARMVSSSAMATPRRSAIASISASTALAQVSRAASVVARMSMLNWQRPGTTLIEPAGTANMPTVPTTSGTAPASRSTASTSSAAAAAASRRWPIGVVPAWLAMPLMLPVQRRLPLMEVTMPSGKSIASSTGPCSMWTSTNPR